MLPTPDQAPEPGRANVSWPLPPLTRLRLFFRPWPVNLTKPEAQRRAVPAVLSMLGISEQSAEDLQDRLRLHFGRIERVSFYLMMSRLIEADKVALFYKPVVINGGSLRQAWYRLRGDDNESECQIPPPRDGAWLPRQPSAH